MKHSKNYPIGTHIRAVSAFDTIRGVITSYFIYQGNDFYLVVDGLNKSHVVNANYSSVSHGNTIEVIQDGKS